MIQLIYVKFTTVILLLPVGNYCYPPNLETPWNGNQLKSNTVSYFDYHRKLIILYNTTVYYIKCTVAIAYTVKLYKQRTAYWQCKCILFILVFLMYFYSYKSNRGSHRQVEIWLKKTNLHWVQVQKQERSMWEIFFCVMSSCTDFVEPFSLIEHPPVIDIKLDKPQEPPTSESGCSC